MVSKQAKRTLLLLMGMVLVCFAEAAFAAMVSGSGVATLAKQVGTNLPAVGKLITGLSYVAGFGFAVGGVVKFKAHKDNPTQVPISAGIVLIFVAAALMFIPGVFKAAGFTIFGGYSGVSSMSGVKSF